MLEPSTLPGLLEEEDIEEQQVIEQLLEVDSTVNTSAGEQQLTATYEVSLEAHWNYFHCIKFRRYTAGVKIDVEGTAYLNQHSFWLAIFSPGMKTFKIAFHDIVDNSWKIPIAHFSATNLTHIKLFGGKQFFTLLD